MTPGWIGALDTYNALLTTNRVAPGYALKWPRRARPRLTDPDVQRV